MAKKEMRELTHAELEVMQILWEKKKALVREVLDEMPEPKPAYNTVSTVIRVLEKKGFVNHKAFGTTYQYFPLVRKKEYTKGYMDTVMTNFFGGSIHQMLSFFNDTKSVSISELEEIIRMMKEDNK
jgi:predicted transcriptional regulator